MTRNRHMKLTNTNSRKGQNNGQKNKPKNQNKCNKSETPSTSGPWEQLDVEDRPKDTPRTVHDGIKTAGDSQPRSTKHDQQNEENGEREIETADSEPKNRGESEQEKSSGRTPSGTSVGKGSNIEDRPKDSPQSLPKASKYDKKSQENRGRKIEKAGYELLSNHGQSERDRSSGRSSSNSSARKESVMKDRPKDSPRTEPRASKHGQQNERKGGRKMEKADHEPKDRGESERSKSPRKNQTTENKTDNETEMDSSTWEDKEDFADMSSLNMEDEEENWDTPEEAVQQDYNKKELNKNYNKKKRTRWSDEPVGVVTEIDGDLFDAPETVSLAHCVGADLAMGAGIAVRFRQEFKSVGELLNQRVKQGGVAYIQHKDRYVFYLVTKQKSTGENKTCTSTIIYLQTALSALHFLK